MQKIVLLLVFFSFYLYAQEEYSIRIAYGVESDQDLGEILTLQDPTKHRYDFNVVSLDAGVLLAKDAFDLPLDFYLKGGVAIFHSENLKKYPELIGMPDLTYDDVYEFTFYIKMYYNLEVGSNTIRLGFGEGGSYVSSYLPPEVIEERTETPDDPKYSKYLNYLDISCDIDLGKLFDYQPLYNTYLGYTIKHRSGIFGTINGVHGGSNYNTISIERNF